MTTHVDFSQREVDAFTRVRQAYAIGQVTEGEYHAYVVAMTEKMLHRYIAANPREFPTYRGHLK